MKIKFSIKHFIAEMVLSALLAFVFSIFAQNFEVWFIGILVLLLLWHHCSEYRLLQLLSPKKNQHDNLNAWGHISQTVGYYKQRHRREKIKTLRMLSKLNRNIQYLPDGIIIFRHDGQISWCNNMAQEIFDFYWDKKVKKNIFSVIFYEEFKNYCKQTNHKRPLVLLTAKERYIEINLTPYDSALTLVIVRDVTQIIRLLHSRQTFLANMNHELRTPLTVLQGYLELLEGSENLSEIEQKAVNAMTEQSKRMANLLQQLNILAKIEHSTNENHNEVNLSELILGCQRSVEMLVSEHQQVVFSVLPNVRVMGDESQLQSAVSNLIFNAIKHSGEQSKIFVRLVLCPEGVEFSVADNGQGIAPQHIPHLTERFYRVDESRSNRTGGSGLGLAIVKHALEQHQAQLQVSSEVGKGSCFSFILPRELLRLCA